MRKATKTAACIVSFAALGVSAAAAFSSINVPYNRNGNPTSGRTTTAGRTEQAEPPETAVRTAASAAARTTTTTSHPWRVVLDVGREPLSTMPFDWARSGCRMPIVIPSDFEERRRNERSSSSTNIVLPKSDTVSFTGPDGAVVRPVVGGSWEFLDNGAGTGSKPKEIQFTMSFPEALERRDVRIEAGTTIRCTAPAYTKAQIDALNAEFYEAREDVWKVGGELNEMSSRQGAPKKWNFETNRWEKRYSNANPLEWGRKRLQYMAAKARQEQKNAQRPNPKTLSDRGKLPGIDDYVFVAKDKGIIKTQDGAVLGRWSMEPMIDDKPVSYYN